MPSQKRQNAQAAPSVALSFLLIIFTGFFGLLPQPQAYFIPAGSGVRPAGMGEAFTSVADDSNALLYNPAGLSKLSGYEWMGMYSDLYSNLNTRVYTGEAARFGYNYAALGVPLEAISAGMGVGWLQFNTAFYQEQTLIIGYGQTWSVPYLKDWGMPLHGGASLKGLQWQVASNSFVDDPNYFSSPNKSKSGLTADFGLLLEAGKQVCFGASVENAVPVDMGLIAREVVPPVFRAGAAYTIAGPMPWMDSAAAVMEMMQREDGSERPFTPKAGLEAWMFGRSLGLRAGYNLDQVSAGFSLKQAWPNIPVTTQVDYAFSWPLAIEGTAGSHRVGLVLGWDLALEKKRRVLRAQAQADAERLSREAEALKIQAAVEQTEQAEKIKKIQEEIANADGAAEQAIYEADRAYAQLTRLAGETLSRCGLTARQETFRLKELAANALAKAHAALAQARAEYAGATQHAGLTLEEITAAAASCNSRTAEAQSCVREVLEAGAAALHARFLTDERDPGKIVVGVDTTIYADHCDDETCQNTMAAFQAWLKRQVPYPFEIRLLRSESLVQEFIKGDIDLLLSGNVFFAPFVQRQTLDPVLTIQRQGSTRQTSCFFALQESGLVKPAQLKDKRIAYIDPARLEDLRDAFFQDVPGFSGLNFFRGTLRCKNGVDALMKLELNQADAILDYATLLDLYQRLQATMPQKITLIARGSLYPYLSLLFRPSKSAHKNLQVQKVLALLKQAHEIPEAAPLLNYFRVERIVAVGPRPSGASHPEASSLKNTEAP